MSEQKTEYNTGKPNFPPQTPSNSLFFDIEAWHELTKTCPGCGKDCWKDDLDAVAIRFRRCDCDDYPFGHCVAVMWHVKCIKVAKEAK